MIAPPNPLPDWLTRLLDAPADRSFAPTRGDRLRGDPPRSDARPPPPQSEDALDTVIVRGLAIAVTGLVWGAILVMTARHLLH